MEEFRTLKADEIDLRVGTVGKKGYTLLLYKNARVDMDILDETVGSENWQRDHKEIKGNLYCGVGIWDEDKQQWIWKWDCGTESNTEKEKGEASDSFKRACVNVGIGRELYTSPFVFIACETECYDGKHYKIKNPSDISLSNSMRVKEITYTKDRVIKDLVIVDSKGVVRFSTKETPKPAEPNPSGSGLDLDPNLLKEVKALNIDLDKVRAYLKKESVFDITNEELKTCIEQKKANLSGK